MQTLQVTSERRGDGAIVALRGELDMHSAGRLEQELSQVASAGAVLVVVDLRELAYTDSTGLAAILRSARRAQESGHRLVVVRGPGPIQWRFETTGIDRLVEMVDDPAAVLPE